MELDTCDVMFCADDSMCVCVPASTCSSGVLGTVAVAVSDDIAIPAAVVESHAATGEDRRPDANSFCFFAGRSEAGLVDVNKFLVWHSAIERGRLRDSLGITVGSFD